MINDNISDMLTRIRNANSVKKAYTDVTYSKINVAILKILVFEGYIDNYSIELIEIQKKEKIVIKKKIRVFLRYNGWWIKKSFISCIERISRPGKRIFVNYKNFKNVIIPLNYNQGIAIISTSSGIMSHLNATQLKKGGEILCYIE
jgi:small subunit ribosomal protein S8